MALTGTQKAQIRRLLGYPARFHQTQPDLEQAFLALAGVPDDESQVVDLLDRCVEATTGLEDKIKDAEDRLQASSVGSIVLNPGEIGALKSQGARFVRQMASILGVEVQSNAFGGRGNNDFDM